MGLVIKVVISYIDVDGCEDNVIGRFIPPGVTTPLTLLSSVLSPPQVIGQTVHTPCVHDLMYETGCMAVFECDVMGC